MQHTSEFCLIQTVEAPRKKTHPAKSPPTGKGEKFAHLPLTPSERLSTHERLPLFRPEKELVFLTFMTLSNLNDLGQD